MYTQDRIYEKNKKHEEHIDIKKGEGAMMKKKNAFLCIFVHNNPFHSIKSIKLSCVV